MDTLKIDKLPKTGTYVRVQTAKHLPSMLTKFNQILLAKIVTGDETLVHCFELIRKIGINIWLS